MSKRKTWFVLLAVLSLVTLVALAIPKPAQAAIVTVPPPKWSGTTYTGWDTFYGATVIAYEEGTSATLEAQARNDTGTDVTIKSATLTFDWGSYNATSITPTQLRPNDVAIVKFQFNVPTTTTVSNATLHTYRIDVVYEEPAFPVNWNRVAGDFLGWGNGVNTIFWLSTSPIVPGTASIYFVDGTTGAVTPQDPSAYTLNAFSGQVTFAVAPPLNKAVLADYWFPNWVAWGDGQSKIFQIGLPGNGSIVSGSESICIADWLAGTITKLASTAYTIDYRTGKLTLNTAPYAWQVVMFAGSIEWHWVYTSDQFAVYSADQADAQALNQQWDSMGLWSWYWPDCTAAWKLASESQVEYDLGDTEYARGNFASAEGHYQTAVTKLQAAMDADVTFGTAWENRDAAEQDAETANLIADTARIEAETAQIEGETALLAKEGAKIDAEIVLLQAQARLTNSEAGKADSFGTFVILIGAAAILLGIGGLLWGVSRLTQKPTL